MFELENLYFVISSRSWKFCRIWYLDYHGFEATTQLSTGRNGTPTSNMVQIHTGYLLANQDIPPSYSFKQLRSWTFFRYFHPVPSKASPVGNPTPHAKEHLDLHSSTHIHRVTDMYNESETEDGITDEECSDMEIEYISLPKLKRGVRRSDLTGDQVFLCYMPRPAVPVDQMYKMHASDGNDDGLDPVRRKLRN